MASVAGRSLVWTAVESGGLFLLSFGVLVILARTLGPAELGTAALAVGTVQLFAMAIDTLVHDAIVQRAELTDVHLDSGFWASIAIGILCSVLCWCGAPLMGRLFGSDDLVPLLIVGSLTLPLTGATTVPIAILRRHFQFKALALRTLYGRLAGGVVAVLLVVLGFGIWGLLAQHIVQAIVNAASVWRATEWRPRPVFRRRLLMELVSFGILSVGTRLSWVAGARLFTMLVGYFLGLAAVGYINVAQRVVDTINDVLTGAAYNLSLPIFSRRQADRGALARVYTQAVEYAALAVQPVFAGIGVCAPAIVRLFFGDAWAPAIPLVQIVAVGTMFQFILLFGEAALMAVGRPSYAFLFAFISFVSVMAWFVVMPPGSQADAAVIWSARSVVAGPFLLLVVHRVLGRDATMGFLKAWFVPWVAITAMVAAVLAVEYHAPIGYHPAKLLLIQVPLGAIVYVATVLLIKRELIFRFIALIAAGRSREPVPGPTPEAPVSS
jgi:O-antigen/teichoic acid export membrane protein